jgi:hypothetical protein
MNTPALLLAQTHDAPPHLLVVGLVAAVAGAGWLIWRAARRRDTGRRPETRRGDDRG